MLDAWHKNFKNMNQSGFSLLAHIATQVHDVDLEITVTHNFVATSHQMQR